MNTELQTRQVLIVEDKESAASETIASAIDRLIPISSSLEDLLARLQREGYEIKRGKYISARAPDQERFTRLKTLGTDYTEEVVTSRIAGGPRPSRQPQQRSGTVSLLIDIQNNIKAQQSAGYKHWATIENLKRAAETLNFLTEHGIGSIKRINKARAHGLYVERRAPRRADQTLHGRCRRRKYLIRRRRRHNDQINRLGINAAPFKRLLCGCGSQRGSRFRRSIDEASSFNAGTRTNPFIRSFNAVGSEPSGKVLIGDAGRRKRGPCGNDAGVFG